MAVEKTEQEVDDAVKKDIQATQDEVKESAAKFEESVQEKLNKTFGTEDSTLDDSTEDTDEAKEATLEDSDDSKKDDESKEKPAADAAKKEDSTSEKSAEKIGLSDALYRAAIHAEWTPEEIKDFYEKTPELALKTFDKMHKSMNSLTKEFAALGRAKAKAPVVKSKDVVTTAEVKKIDFSAIEKEYGDDPIVAVLKAVVAQNETLQTKLGSVEKTDVVTVTEESIKAKIDETARLQGQIDAFFTSPDIKPYDSFYGKGSDFNKLTGEQQGIRFKVLEEADAILMGAEIRGVSMTVSQAMEKAHLIVSESVKEKIIREDIKAKIVKRAKGMTLQPTGSKPVLEGKPKTGDAMEKKVASNLKKVFG